MQTFHGASLHRFLPYLAVVVFVGLSCAALTSHFNFVDDSYYVSVAKALASGQGYTNIYLPEPVRHTHFPPGLPALLSVPMRLGLALGPTIILSKLILILCAALGLLAFLSLGRIEGYKEAVVAWAVALAAVSIALVGYTCRVGSEMPYMLLSVLALLAARRYRLGTQMSWPGIWWGIAAGVLLAFAILTRTIGVMLLGGLAIDMVWRCEFKRLGVILAPAGLILMAWFLRTSGSTGTSDYFKEFEVYRSHHSGSLPLILTEPARNVWSLVHTDIPRIILSLLGSDAVQTGKVLGLAAAPLQLGVSALVLAGLLVSLRSKARPIGLYLVLYSMLIIIYPWEPSRFLVPVVPFLCLFFVDGLVLVAQRLTGWRKSLPVMWLPQLVSVVLVICVASSLVSDARFVATTRRTGDYSPRAAEEWNDTMDAYRWIEVNTPENAVIGCAPTIEANVYLFTGRKAIAISANIAGLAPPGVSYVLKIANKADYGSLQRRIEDRVVRALQEDVDRTGIAPVFENQGAVIYRIGRVEPANSPDHQPASTSASPIVPSAAAKH